MSNEMEFFVVRYIFVWILNQTGMSMFQDGIIHIKTHFMNVVKHARFKQIFGSNQLLQFGHQQNGIYTSSAIQFKPLNNEYIYKGEG